MVFGRGPGDDLPRVAAQRELGFGKRGRKRAKLVDRGGQADGRDRVHFDRRFLTPIARNVDLLQNRRDRFVFEAAGPRGQALGILGVDGQFGLRNGGLQDALGAGGRDGLQVVHRHLLCRIGRLRELLDHFFDLLVVLPGAPGQDRPGLGIAGQSHVGQGSRQHLDDHGGIGIAQRVSPDLLLPCTRLAAVDLLDGLADSGLVRQRRPDHDFPGLVVDDDVDVGEQPFEHIGNGGWIGDLQRVGGQSRWSVGRCVGCEPLEQLGHPRVVARLGPDRQFARRGVGQHLDRRQIGSQLGQGHFEPPLLGGSGGVDGQRRAFDGWRVRFELLDHAFDRLVIRRGRHDGQSQILGIRGDLGPRYQILDHLQQIFGRRLGYRMEPQDRRVRRACDRLELFKCRSDHLLICWNGQRDQAAGFGIER